MARTHRIALIPGDGIGVETVASACSISWWGASAPHHETEPDPRLRVCALARQSAVRVWL